MTVKEKDYCVDLLLEGLKNAKQSKEDFKKLNDSNLSDTERNIAELQGQNHLGYAEGIYHSLVTLKYNHELMKELSSLI
jgi:hypothetical protein